MPRRLAIFLSCLLLAAGAARAAPLSVKIGGDVQVSEATTGSLTAMGGRVSVDAPVAGSLRAAGGQLIVGADAAVHGRASLAGGSITVKGPIEGDLRAAGGHIRIDGPVGGDAHIAGGMLSLGPDARIAGKLDFRGGELQQDPAAQVIGGIEHIQRGGWQHHQLTAAERYTRGWFWTGMLLVLAALLAGALPGPSQRLALELRERPWVAVLLGFLALTAIPVAAVMLMLTIIGIPIAILALVFYAGLLLVGYVWLAVVLGGLVLDRFRPEIAAVTAWRVGAAVLSMLVLALLVRLPLVGGSLRFLAVGVGIGMIAAAVFRSRQPPAGTAAA